MPSEISGGSEAAGLKPEQIQRQREALTQVSTHVRYVNREVENLPPTVSHIVELICHALDNLIEGEQRSLSYIPPKSDARRNLTASVKASLKQEAGRQLESALQNLTPM